MMPLISELRYGTNEPIPETESHREQTTGCQGRGGGGKEGNGRLGLAVQISIYIMDKQQGSTV